jgi:hypothetical protein
MIFLHNLKQKITVYTLIVSHYFLDLISNIQCKDSVERQFRLYTTT